MLENIEKKPIAYSYVRFSTTKQELGDSLRRQVDACEAYCKKHELELHPVSYRDLGVSAFKRKNLEKGALAAFIEAVNCGKIEKGSFLIIEQFDRLSRADVDVALRLLLDLVHRGIVLVTLVDEKIWDKITVKDIGNLILAIVFMSRANNESATKAKRLRDAWGQKKLHAGEAGARIVTSECPLWLQASDDKKGFVVLEAKAESVRKVFALRLAGLGAVAIAARANKESWPVPGKPPTRLLEAGQSKEATWWPSNITRILVNRAVLGEYQPHKNAPEGSGRIPVGDPVLGYFPAILDETTFLRVQAARARRSEKGNPFTGRRDASYKNWLQGILQCECGRGFVRKNKNSLAQPGYSRYYCQGRNTGVTKCPGANAKELETAILDVVSHVAPEYFEGTARAEALKGQLDVLEVDVSAAKQSRDRYVEAIGSSKAPVAALMLKVTETEAILSKAEHESAVVRAQLADLSGDSDSIFESIVKAVKSVDSIEARAKLREELSRVISKAIVHQTDGYIEVHLRGISAPVVRALGPAAVLPGVEYDTVKVAPGSEKLTEEEREHGKITVDEAWWASRQVELKKQRNL